MDQRAQISIEYILLVSIILLIIIVFALVITDQSEQNNIATAVQLGASNATANITLTNTSQSPVQVTEVTMSNGTTNQSVTINMTVHFSRSVTTQQATILSSIKTSLQSSGYNNSVISGGSLLLTTSKHIYNITLG